MLASDSQDPTMLNAMGVKKSSRQYKSLVTVADVFQSLVHQRDQTQSAAGLVEKLIETTEYFKYLEISSETNEEAQGRVDNVMVMLLQSLHFGFFPHQAISVRCIRGLSRSRGRSTLTSNK